MGLWGAAEERATLTAGTAFAVTVNDVPTVDAAQSLYGLQTLLASPNFALFDSGIGHRTRNIEAPRSAVPLILLAGSTCSLCWTLRSPLLSLTPPTWPSYPPLLAVLLQFSVPGIFSTANIVNPSVAAAFLMFTWFLLTLAGQLAVLDFLNRQTTLAVASLPPHRRLLHSGGCSPR